MASPADDADVLVRSLFKVNDAFQLPEGESEYRVAYEADSGPKFERLHRELAAKGLVPWLTGTTGDCVLMVRKKQPPKQARSMIPLLMALFSLASVSAFAILEQEIYSAYAPNFPWQLVVFAYGACVVMILAVHEFGHRWASKRQGTISPTPYVIPGIPTVTAFLPALGIISPQREPAVNKNRLFDLMIAGPLAALAATLVLNVIGEVTAVPSTLLAHGTQTVNSYISVSQINPSVLQYAMNGALSPFLRQASPGYVNLSPVADAAAVGFMLTFAGLLPLVFFDGGYLSSAVLGSRGTRAATYLGVLTLITFDTPNYWALAIVVLLLAGRQFNTKVYDEVTGVSPRRRAIFLLVVVLAFLCVPVPQNLATVPLG